MKLLPDVRTFFMDQHRKFRSWVMPGGWGHTTESIEAFRRGLDQEFFERLVWLEAQPDLTFSWVDLPGIGRALRLEVRS